MLLRERPTFAELVFHVLAHVRRTAAEPASVYDADWVRFCEGHLGPPNERTLAEDAEALGALAPGHASLARAQLVAWLFGDLERASAAASRELGSLEPEDVDAPELLAPLAEAGPAPELLRLAAELERPFFERLPAPAVDFARAEAALTRQLEAAPGLGDCRVALVRSLGLRGRVRGDLIWVGVPVVAGRPSFEHVAWQASHEASVREVGRATSGAERRVEQMAVVLLAARAERAGLSEEHARWLSHFGPNAPDTGEHSLSEVEARAVRELLARS